MLVIMLLKAINSIFFSNIDLTNICFKIDKIFFFKYLDLSSKKMFNLNLRKLPSQYGEVSVMLNESGWTV